MVTQPESPEQTPGNSRSTLEAAELIQGVTVEARQLEPPTVDKAGDFERQQNLIAQIIVWLFVFVVVVLVLAYIVPPIFGAADRIVAGADKARELANTLLLPIVTLVLGYYFGKRAG